MSIRKAIIEDCEAIAPLLMLASGDVIYKFIGEEHYERALGFLLRFVKSKDNQYSHQNCYVVERDGNILAAALVYNGAQLDELRKPVLGYVHKYFDSNFIIEDETQAGEFYLDSFGVAPSQQGKGLGSKLLSFLIQEIVHKQGQPLGLLVDKTNHGAKKLYTKLGFEYVEDKELLSFEMEHLQVQAVGNRNDKD